MPRIDLVSTDVEPNYLNNLALEMFRMWREFALGYRHLNGKSLVHPTGKYAAAISLRRFGSRMGVREPGRIPQRVVSHIAIIADSDQAPEADILETGHDQIDMLNYLNPSTFYPMHRHGPTPGTVAAGPDVFPMSSPGRRRVRQMWTQTREAAYAGHARTPAHPSLRGDINTSRTGPAWTIPAMPAYSPAQHLVELFANEKGVEITYSE